MQADDLVTCLNFNKRQLTGLHIDLLNTWQLVYFLQFVTEVRHGLVASCLYVCVTTQFVWTVIVKEVKSSSECN